MKKLVKCINTNKEKLSLGIKILSGYFILLTAYSIFASVMQLINLEEYNKFLLEQGYSQVEITSGQVMVSLSIGILLLISVILILLKKVIGGYLFIGIQLINIIASIIINGFNPNLIFGFILPALLVYFIYRQKDIYLNK